MIKLNEFLCVDKLGPQIKKSVSISNFKSIFVYLIFNGQHNLPTLWLSIMVRQLKPTYGNCPQQYIHAIYSDIFQCQKSWVLECYL